MGNKFSRKRFSPREKPTRKFDLFCSGRIPSSKRKRPLRKDRNMTKKLKIRFVKFRRALVMQILEQEGLFKATEHVRALGFPAISSGCIFCAVLIRVCTMTSRFRRIFQTTTPATNASKKLSNGFPRNSFQQRENWKSERSAKCLVTANNGLYGFSLANRQSNSENRVILPLGITI